MSIFSSFVFPACYTRMNMEHYKLLSYIMINLLNYVQFNKIKIYQEEPMEILEEKYFLIL